MTEVIETNQKPAKNPKESAANALREALYKEWEGKIKDQAKKVVNASKIYQAEKSALSDLISDMEAEKASLNATLKDL